MSILQEYESIEKKIGHKKYHMIEKYLEIVCPREKYNQYEEELRNISQFPDEDWFARKKELESKYGIVQLSDILYKEEEWEKFDKWYNKVYLNRNVEILGDLNFLENYDDVRCNVLLYQNSKLAANIIVSYDSKIISYLSQNSEKGSKEVIKSLIYKDFDKYIKLPKLSNCSKLLQEIYIDVSESDSKMCYITDEDWSQFYSKRYSERDILNLKEEIKKYKLDKLISFDYEDEYKIIGWTNLELKFNDDRKLSKNKDKESR
ncbi:MAG: hypothetical protein J6A52_06735 [Bacilli bacterium]|nr:hypothetical protein [Bacilli bacterium]